MKLPTWLLNILTTMILPLAKLLGKNGLVEVLNNIKTKDPNWYATLIIVSYRALVVHLKPVADATPAQWDNDTVDVAIAAIKQSAEDNSVSLPDVTIVPKPAAVLDNPPL